LWIIAAKEIEMITVVAGCEVSVKSVIPKKGYTMLTIGVKAPTRVFEVTYDLDESTGEILLTRPYTLHREMRAVHAAWREQGVMSKVMVPLSWYQRLMGVDPQTSYRRFFTHRWWEEVQG
jgi:hypothetical protein